MPVNDEFALWATGFAGMDGGNIDSAIWICGIEPNLGIPPRLLPIDDFCYTHRTGRRVPWWNDQFRRTFPGFLNWGFDQKVAKILLHYHGRDIAAYPRYMQEELYTQNGSCFKLNLFPLTAPGTDHWSLEHFELTGLRTRTLYRAWCTIHRFPFIRQLVRVHPPRIVVATGSGGFRPDFILAFAHPDNLFRQGIWHPLATGCRRVEEIRISNERTLLITPFLGRGGLMADEDLTQLADLIHHILGG
jgi:hypothetical protein